MRNSHLNSETVHHEHTRRNTPERNRESTDSIFKIVFIIIFLTWFALCCYVLSSSEVWKKYHESSFVSIWFERFFYHGPSCAITIMALSAISTILFLIMLRYIPNFCIYIIVFIIASCILSALIGICINLYELSQARSAINVILVLCKIFGIIFYIIYGGIVLLSIRKVGFSTIVDIVSRISKGFLSNIHMMLCVIIMMTLQIFVAFLIFMSGYVYDMKSQDYGLTTIFFATLYGIYMMNFIYCYGRMIICPTIATWFRAENKSEIPKTLVLNYAAIITKYHMGTVAIASIPLLPFFISIYAVFKQKIFNLQTRLDRCTYILLALNLIFSSTEYSTVITSLYGGNLYQSTKHTLRLLTKSCPLSLAYIEVTREIWGLKIAFSILLALMTIISFNITNTLNLSVIGLLFVGVIFNLIFSLPVLMLLDLISHVNLICLMEDNAENDLSRVIGQQIMLN